MSAGCRRRSARVTGVITGGTGVFVVPAVPYLQGLSLKKEDLVQALGLSFTVSTIALAIGLAREHAFAVGDLGESLFAVVPALLGMWIGQRVRGRISPANLPALVFYLSARPGHSIVGTRIRLIRAMVRG